MTQETKDDLIKKIEELTKESGKEPLLLTKLAQTLAKDFSRDYRVLMDGKNLKKFIDEDIEGLCSVENPDAKLEVAVCDESLPKEELQWKPKTEKQKIPLNPSKRKSNNQVVSPFLRLVAKLPTDEAKQIQIPAYILGKLIGLED